MVRASRRYLEALVLQAASTALVSRISELRQAIEVKETERQGLLLQQKSLEAERRAAGGTAQGSGAQSAQTEVGACLCILSWSTGASQAPAIWAGLCMPALGYTWVKVAAVNTVWS